MKEISLFLRMDAPTIFLPTPFHRLRSFAHSAPCGIVTSLRRGDHRACRQVKPLLLAVPHGAKADPLEHGLLVMVEIKDEYGWGAVQKMNTSLPAPATEAQAAHAKS